MTSSAAATSDRPDWAALPPDLLGSVAQLLPVPDFLYFSAVSKAFAAAVGRKHVLPSGPQPPWLMLPSSHVNPGDNDDDVFTFLEVPTLKAYHIPVRGLSGHQVVGSNNGWLVTVKNTTDVRLLNPLTRSQIALPSLDTIIKGSDAARVTLYTDRSGRNIAVVVVRGICLGFAREGDDRWTFLDHPEPIYDDVVFCNEKLYCFSCGFSSFCYFDLSVEGYPRKDLELESNHQRLEGYSSTHLVIDGEIFRVLVHYGYISFCLMMKVFKLDLAGRRWKQVEDLGDRALFLGTNTVSISTRNAERMKGNQIYFMGYCDSTSPKQYLSRYDLRHEMCEGHHRETSKMSWERAIWFSPNLS